MAVATAAAVRVEAVVVAVMVAVVQEAATAVKERMEEAEAVVAMVAVAKVVEVAGVVQEAGCGAGALLPDALHGGAERVVVARAGLAHQSEHDRLGLGLGHAAGTHRDGSSRASVGLACVELRTRVGCQGE